MAKHIYEGELRHAAGQGVYSPQEGSGDLDAFHDVLDTVCGTKTTLWEDVDYGRVRITVEQLESDSG